MKKTSKIVSPKFRQLITTKQLSSTELSFQLFERATFLEQQCF